MTRQRNGPNVEWVGLIVRTDDGQVHAVEMDGRGGRVTADLVLNPYNTQNKVFPITAIINGVGKYWQEGATMGPDVQPHRELRPSKIRPQDPEKYAAIEQAVIQGVLAKPRAIEGGEGDGTRTCGPARGPVQHVHDEPAGPDRAGRRHRTDRRRRRDGAGRDR